MSEGGCGRGCVGWMSVAALCAQRRSTHPTTLAHALRASLRAAAYLPRKKGALKCKGCATQAPTCEHFKTPPPVCFCPLFFLLLTSILVGEAHRKQACRSTSQPVSHSLLGRSSARGASAAGGVGRSAGARATRTRAHTHVTPHTHAQRSRSGRPSSPPARCVQRQLWVGSPPRVGGSEGGADVSTSLRLPISHRTLRSQRDGRLCFCVRTRHLSTRHDTTHTHWAFDPRTACLCVCARASSLSPTLSPTSVSRLVPVRRDLDSPLSRPLFEARWPSRSSMTLPSTGS